ncbi:coiled-coil domain-containing protein 103 [Hyperolius riggenbachi]|uniref:coiled-coil domain-containing protein 103 n=1 Tax=Hyperolius riggenbachi TaxID=752182 RepID=UPI0035A2DCD6
MNTAEVLDFRELERELASAVAADEKYRTENDAKFRAIHQKVASYEEFRNIVLASNLKPLERKDKIGGDRKQPWNPTATTSSSSKEAACAVLQETPSNPRNAFEFSRDWRRTEAGKRYDFLLGIGAKMLSHIFHAEVCSGLLGEILIILEADFQRTQHQEVMDILNCLATTQRFHLNLAFLSQPEKESCRELFLKLQKVASEEKEADGKSNAMLMQLMALYKITD